MESLGRILGKPGLSWALFGTSGVFWSFLWFVDGLRGRFLLICVAFLGLRLLFLAFSCFLLLSLSPQLDFKFQIGFGFCFLLFAWACICTMKCGTHSELKL